MVSFRGKCYEPPSHEALDYCSRSDILADCTPLSEISPGILKYKVAGVITSVPYDSSQFKKKLWSCLIVIADPSLAVVPSSDTAMEEIREIKAHLFSNEMNAYPELHRGDIVLMKHVQCEYSPFGTDPRPTDLRIFSQNDFTVLCCHPEIKMEDVEPRPPGRKLLPHQVAIVNYLHDWLRRKEDKLPLIFSQLPSLNQPFKGESKEYTPAPATTFTNFPPVVSHGAGGIARPYNFYLYIESATENVEVVTSDNEKLSYYSAELTDGGIISPRDLEFAFEAGAKEPFVKTRLELSISKNVKEAYEINLKPHCYYKVSEVYISDPFQAVYLSSSLLPALELTKKTKFEEIPEDHHMAAVIRKRLEKLPSLVEEFKNNWMTAYVKLEQGEEKDMRWLRTY